MQPIKPFFKILGDSSDNIMARSGEIVGFSKTRVVWRYGFLPNSDSSRAYGVSIDTFIWVIATYQGKTLDSFRGFALELPERFKKIIDTESK